MSRYFTSGLDGSQVLSNSHDESNQALRTVPIGGTLVTAAYDYISATYPSGTQEVYVFKSGGSSGTTVATITVNYTDSTKSNISSVQKS